MNIDTSNLLNSILEELSSLSYVHPGDVPNINLYMDQVTTFMDEQLASTKRYPDDKILTKTMINNYTKNNLLPPPVKKNIPESTCSFWSSFIILKISFQSKILRQFLHRSQKNIFRMEALLN